MLNHKCEYCGKIISVADDLRGGLLECQACKEMCDIPVITSTEQAEIKLRNRIPSTFNAQAVAVDKFKIRPFFRFTIVFRALSEVAIICLVAWLLLDANLHAGGPIIILLGAAGWSVWDIIKAFRKLAFSIEISDQGIIISGYELKWSDIESAQANKTSVFFDTFIQLISKDGCRFKIPACIQQDSLVLAKIEKHFPDIKKELLREN